MIESIFVALDFIFDEHKKADKVIEKILKQHRQWGARDRRFYAESVYEIVRWWRRYWALLGKEPSLNRKDLWLLWGIHWQSQGYDLPNWEELDFLQKETLQSRQRRLRSPMAVESMPDWLWELGKKELGDRWPDIIHSLNEKAHVYLRVNELKITREELIKRLALEEVSASAVPEVPSALVLRERKNVFITKAFKEGLFEVQDAASQMVAPLLKLEPGLRVIDACAGAGGKALHIGSVMKNKGKVLALDIHAWKLEELKKRARRDGVDNVETRVIDSSKVIKRLEGTADRLLLDVPCTGLGVLRRNPDTKWHLSPEEIERVRNVQKSILSEYHKLLKPKGIMVYSTCSILPSENADQIAWFLKEFPDWKLLSEKNIWPVCDGFDGFYAACLQKS